jgi:hypothetical protein
VFQNGVLREDFDVKEGSLHNEELCGFKSAAHVIVGIGSSI